MPVYKVAWQTTPAMGSEYYNGHHTVFARNDEEATQKTRQDKARSLGRREDEIVILEVTRGMP
jgi:hypothetical protein